MLYLYTQVLTTPFGYLSLDTPMFKHNAPATKLCFSLIILSFGSQIFRAPAGEPRKVVGKLFFLPYHCFRNNHLLFDLTFFKPT